MSSGDPETKKRIMNKTLQLLQQRKGLGVRIEDVANAAGISRQAVYMYFPNRTQLFVETARYVDQIQGLDERLQEFRHASGGLNTLQTFVRFWGNYIPKIFGLAKVLRELRDTDKAAAAAWDDRMQALRYGCQCVIDCLDHEGLLASGLTPDQAVDLLWGLLSIALWEDLTVDRKWTQAEYLDRILLASQRILVRIDT